MQFPASWLKDFVNPSVSTEQLAHELTMAGLEVESLNAVAPLTANIVVGQVREVVPHPNADKLKVCQVDVGADALLTIVCGAPNVVPGIKVPCALVGAQLPPAEEGGKPFMIKLSKLRGIESQGMLCAARELKLPDATGGLLILAEDTPVGQDIRTTLNLDDKILEIKLTPNRADCLSIFGIAREVAAITDTPLQAPTCGPIEIRCADTLPVKISAPDLCGRFSGRVIRNVNAQAKTPTWMVERLERAGQRSISALVDISNYVMLALGQPSHLFDLNKLQGSLDVRWAHSGEQLTLLNGTSITLDQTVGVLADEKGVQSLAGIMGGEHTAVSLDTRDVYLEVAFWQPDSIRGRAQRYRCLSDASHRFERGVDYASTVIQLDYITRLILDICGGDAGPVDDQIINLPKRAPITLRLARANQIIGVPISAAQVKQIFTHLGLPFELANDVFVVTPPSYRFDLEIEEDLIEEIVRVYGFDNIPARAPVAPNVMLAVPSHQRSLHVLRHALAARDYNETINFSFVEEAWEQDFAGNAQPVRLLNPIASQFSVMRSTLIGSLVQGLRHNLNRKAERIRLFEIGKVFIPDATVSTDHLSVAGFAQPLRVAALAYGPACSEQWGVASRWVDFFDMKGDLEALFAPLEVRFVKTEHPALHPGRSAVIEYEGRPVGCLGELHPRWLQKYDLSKAPVLFEIDAQALTQRILPKASEGSKFPPVKRDIAVIVDQKIEAQTLLDELQKAALDESCQDVQQIALFDVFRPHAESTSGLAAHEKSLAFRVTLQNAEETLQDKKIDTVMQTLVERLVQVFGARLRG